MIVRHTPQLTGTVMQIAEGRAGVNQTIYVMRQLVDAGKVDMRIRQCALNLIRLVPQKDFDAEIVTIFEFVRDRIRYTHDVVGVETLAPAYRTLEIEQGDCDDKSVLLAALLESIGVETRFIITGYHGDTFEHVYVGAIDSQGRLIPLDSTENHMAGWEPPDYTVRAVEGM